MKRLTKQILGAMAALILAGAGVVFAAVIWAAATPHGTRWLLESAPALGGISFSARKIEGRLIDHLLLTGIRVDAGRQKLEIGSIELRWKPLLLLSGTVAVNELKIGGVRIRDDSPSDNKPPTLAWPELSGNAQLFDMTIERLQVTDVTYRHLLEEPVRVTSIDGSVSWQDGSLSVSGLKAASPSGTIQGAVSAGFSRPSVTADLDLAKTLPLAEMDRFSLQVRPGGRTSTEQVAGIVTVAGSAGTRKLLELSGEVGMTNNAFNLRRILLARPGQRGEVTADGSLALTPREPVLTLQVTAAGLDLAPELNITTDLSGTLRFAGTPDSYSGTVSLANRANGWRKATVTASYRGTREGMRLAPLKARVLDGSLAGKVDMDWRNGFAVRGEISGRNLNPARIDSGWKGTANFNAAGNLAWIGSAPVSGSVSGDLLESRLHEQALTGGVQADFAGSNVSLSRLVLHGKGFDLHAAGDLNRRLDLSAQISDFSRLVPGSAGTLRGEGWVRWSDRHLSGAFSGSGSALAYGGMRIGTAEITARLYQGPGYPLQLTASLLDAVYDGYALDAVTVAADGTLLRHTVNASISSSGAKAELNLSAGYSAGLWSGNISRLSGGNDSGPWKLEAPAAFAVSSGKISLSPLTLVSGAAERLEAAADLTLNPLAGQAGVKWAGLNLARGNPYLKEQQITGSSRGAVRVDFLPGKQLAMTGSAAGSGTFSRQGHNIKFEQASATFDGGRSGIKVGLEIYEAGGGRLKGTFSSPAPLRLEVPEKGKLAAEFSGIDLALLKPWLPADTTVAGFLSGRAKGSLLSRQRFELDGSATLSGGSAHQEGSEGGLNLTFSSATASWSWRDEALSGILSLTLADHGQARANFQLPVPARFPVAVNPQGPFQAKFIGQFQEKGIITALFPGYIRESFGELDTELAVEGTWEEPQFGGKLVLTRGGAYLPGAGIHLKDVQLSARLEKNLIRVDSCRALSGSGHIEGTALITLSGWQVKGYQGTIRGENFQTVYFPEFLIVSTPEFSFEGTPQKLKVRGELRLPELHLYGSPAGTVIAPSSDVVMEGIIVPAANSSPLALDVQVRVLLGDKVFMKVAGIDAQLGGAMDISLSGLDSIVSSGEIKVVKGRYRTYGVDLNIVRGRLFFSGGPVNNPALDFLALRTIGDVKAGVTVAGTIRKPVTRLYSEPPMPDVDILAYIVLGHPFGTSGEQASFVAQAAGALLTSSQATVLQDQIKNHLGLSTLEIQGGVGGSASPMGYKPLQVTAPGEIPAAVQSGITETVLTVGKFLTPKLYISYGRSLFTGSNLFLLRYDIFRKWQIETQTGSESGADLFYKMEFK